MGSTTGAFMVCLLLTVPALADDLQQDLKARRANAMEAIGPEAMVVLFSAPPRVYSNDVDYEYRQNSDLYYLTGITQPDTILVLMPGNRTNKEVLFVRQPDARREHRQGHTLTVEEATATSGIQKVLLLNEFESFVSTVLSGRPPSSMRRKPGFEEFGTFLGAVKAGRARVGLMLSPQPALSAPLTPAHEFARSIRDRYIGVTVVNMADVVWNLRQVKTAYEQTVLRRSLQISNEAHRAGMSAARPGVFEYEVESAIEAVYLKNGAMSWGYPSIVGSGPNATILHYSESSRQAKEGDLLLVDAAASFQYLTGDITRTYPVSGSFTSVQRDLYELVLAAQDAAMKVAKVGGTPDDIEEASEVVIRQGLLKRGLITDATGDQFRMWYTHGICHFIGMDVHDVGDYQRPFEAGMAFVIEPGLYIREQALKDLPSTPQNAALIEKIRPAVTKYAGIGVRVEDSFLLTDTGLERLSSGAPRTVAEIEAFMKGRAKPSEKQ
jgi:Xaa-Pro aminopeptidase